MSVICPTITAFDTAEYKRQMDNVAGFARRIHIDLMDGEFAPTKSPGLEKVWWPHELEADIHLMYQRPMDHLEQLIHLKPRMVVIHNEVHVHHMHFAAELHKEGIQVGLALLQDTPVEYSHQIMHSFDHVLVFSGNLGHHGGDADLSLLDKVRSIRDHHPEVEIGWDGGINDQNAKQLVEAGVEVLNVGGYVQRSDDPAAAYAKLKEAIGES
jgi:ribulose-phosphate 3-epimerase